MQSYRTRYLPALYGKFCGRGHYQYCYNYQLSNCKNINNLSWSSFAFMVSKFLAISSDVLKGYDNNLANSNHNNSYCRHLLPALVKSNISSQLQCKINFIEAKLSVLAGGSTRLKGGLDKSIIFSGIFH